MLKARNRAEELTVQELSAILLNACKAQSREKSVHIAYSRSLVEVNRKAVKTEVDTGASASVISERPTKKRGMVNRRQLSHLLDSG